jgi:hypothetical protein
VPQLDEAGAGSEVDIDATAPDTSEAVTADETQSPADALYPEDQPPAEPEDDEEPLQEDDDEEADEEAEAINAPASLTPEEKERFAQLPLEAQRFATETLARRDRETQQGLESARSAQREAERTAADQVAQTQRDSAERYRNLIQAFQPTPPPAELARRDPTAFLIEKAQYDEDIQQFNALVGQIDGMSQQATQHFEQRDQAWMQEQVSQLRSIPEFADDAKRPEFQRQIGEMGKELGYSDDELANVSAKDIFAINKARQWKLKADKWDGHQKKRNERPRAVGGKFASAPVGNAGTQKSAPIDPLKALYPND